jgi:uncharacterized protein YdaU (DUF1376 family)
MSKSPAFQFYPKDWLASLRTLMMTPAQEGAYIRLLCYCWDSGDCSIPDNDDQLAVMSRLGEGWFKGGSEVLRACFIPHPDKPGFLTNDRLYAEAQKQHLWSRKSSEGGKRSAAKRAEKKHELKGGSRVVPPPPNRPVQPKPNSASASASADKSGGTTYTPQFEELWRLTPKTSCSKFEASQSYQRAIRNGANHEQVVQGMRAYSDFLDRSGSPAAHLTTWLNNRRWESDYDAALATRPKPARTGGSLPSAPVKSNVTTL